MSTHEAVSRIDSGHCDSCDMNIAGDNEGNGLRFQMAEHQCKVLLCGRCAEVLALQINILLDMRAIRQRAIKAHEYARLAAVAIAIDD